MNKPLIRLELFEEAARAILAGEVEFACIALRRSYDWAEMNRPELEFYSQLFDFVGVGNARTFYLTDDELDEFNPLLRTQFFALGLEARLLSLCLAWHAANDANVEAGYPAAVMVIEALVEEWPTTAGVN